jgi:hypothetical protein
VRLGQLARDKPLEAIVLIRGNQAGSKESHRVFGWLGGRVPVPDLGRTRILLSASGRNVER